MCRTIYVSCWVYVSKKEIFKEWTSGMVTGSHAIGKAYIQPKEMIEQYGFAISKKGGCCINEIEAETVKDIFEMYLFGIPINDICIKLKNYQSKTPKGLSQWSAEAVRDILNNEIYTGYQFVSENDTVAVLRVGQAIIHQKIFAVTQKMTSPKKTARQKERTKRLMRFLLS